MDCYREYINFYQENCGAVDDYTFKYFKVFAAECEALSPHYPEQLQANRETLSSVCKQI